MPIDLDHIADAFASGHVDISGIHGMSELSHALSSIGVDISALAPDQIDSIIHQIDGMLAQHAVAHGVQFAGNPGWYQGSSGTWYHNDPSGHYDGNWHKD